MAMNQNEMELNKIDLIPSEILLKKAIEGN